MHELKTKIDFFTNLIQDELTDSRVEHCLRVAEIAQKLAVKHNYANPENAYIAGLVHDITKQKTNEFHINIFNKYNFDYSHIPTASFHAHSASLLLQEYDLDNDILQAVRSHTLGNRNMTLLEQILYASDFLGSKYAKKKKSHELWIKRTEENLLYGVYLKSSITILDLLEKKSIIHPFTLETYNFSLS